MDLYALDDVIKAKPGKNKKRKAGFGVDTLTNH